MLVFEKYRVIVLNVTEAELNVNVLIALTAVSLTHRLNVS